jgi:hypothetical protein
VIEPTDEMVQAFADAKAAVKGCPGLDDGDEQGLAAVLAIVERDYDMLPKFRPHAHAFVRSDDPSFGATFGGGCAAEVGGMTCGWPEQAHRWRPS